MAQRCMNVMVGVLLILVSYTVFLDVRYPFQVEDLFDHELDIPIEKKREWNVVKKRVDFRKNDTQRHCDVYNASRPYTVDFFCVQTKTKPSATVCLYTEFEDIYISHDLKYTGKWEPHVLKDYQQILSRNPDLGVLDLGANIGYYTLLAAKMGHKVVAVEPYFPSIYRIHRALQMEQLSDQVTVVHNAVSDKRVLGTIRRSGDNQGDTRVDMEYHKCIGSCPPPVQTILLDDLLEVIPFNYSILKVDIQGYECQAFTHSEKLFKALEIPYVFMEWGVMREHYQSENYTSADKYRVQQLIKTMFDQSYRPYSHSDDGYKPLDPHQWHLWPFDIIWQQTLKSKEYGKVLRTHFLNWP